MSQTFTVAFTADRNFSVPLGMAVYSLLLHALPGRQFDIHVLDGGVSERVKEQIEGLKREYSNFAITYWDLSSRFKDLPSTFRFTTAAYYRLVLCSLLPQVDLVFYTDADILICEDLGELFALDLGDCYAGATQELSYAQSAHDNFGEYRKHFNIPDDGTPYYCAGQMLLNLKRMREDGVEEKMLKIAYSTPPEALKAQDQDIINCAMHGRIKTIPYKFASIAFFENRILHGCYRDDIGDQCAHSEEDLKDAALHPVVIHYATAKPNILVGPRNKQEERFFVLWKQSPWKNVIPYEPVKIRELAQKIHPCVGKILMAFPKLFIRCPRLLKVYGSLLSFGTRIVRTQS
ncbi:glycosyltransferase family 8 protein [Akkermansia glycaniphila]|uniref:glycosyltransferase family 8 protein n=1 Tax=Akkermansia glycaniphila TaxID=1679444 RepID=UPI001C031191|nr:glycosyltransferase family 8 protein [Akkermansia glycaniphila]MBT9450747.1 glycosyltransferase family 8 protein [Akkermansia glycaniphila]